VKITITFKSIGSCRLLWSSDVLDIILDFFLQIKIAMVGKYTGLSDSYLSVLKVGCNDKPDVFLLGLKRLLLLILI